MNAEEAYEEMQRYTPYFVDDTFHIQIEEEVAKSNVIGQSQKRTGRKKLTLSVVFEESRSYLFSRAAELDSTIDEIEEYLNALKEDKANLEAAIAAEFKAAEGDAE